MTGPDHRAASMLPEHRGAPLDRRRADRRSAGRARAGAPRRVLILGAYRQALAVARSLKRAGLTVMLARPRGPKCWLERSRDVDGVWIHPPIAAPESFVDALESYCRGTDAPDYLFPLGDDELALVSKLGPLGLPPIVVSASPPLLERCQHKESLLTDAAEAGVATAPWSTVASADELKRAGARIGYPLIVKPGTAGADDTQASAPFFNGKARILCSDADLASLLETQAFPKSGVLAQRMAQGPRHNVYFAAWNGRLRAVAQILTLRTDRLDGTGLAVEGISIAPMPGLVDQTRRLAARLGYTGVGCAQFLVDPRDGSTCFLEVNARLGANCAAVIASGLDLPRLFLELMHGDVPMQPASVIGRRYAWLNGDIEGLGEQLRAGRLGPAAAVAWIARMLRAQWRAHSHITFQWRDPWPALSLLAGRISTGLSRRFRSSAR